MNKFFALAFATITSFSATAFALEPMPELEEHRQQQEDRFPGDPAQHKVVYMFNQADEPYQRAILNSIKALISSYEDNIEIAVVVVGPAIQTLTKSPSEDVDPDVYERMAGFSENYNVRWIACGNTMNTLHLEQDDMRDFAEYADVGASALMALQEKGFAAIYW